MLDNLLSRAGKCGICVDCMIKSDARCTHEITSRIVMEKAKFDKKKKKALFTP
jgi:hypothetical protein